MRKDELSVEDTQDEQAVHQPIHEEIMAAKRLTLQDVKDHISGPMLSVILHIIAIAFLSTIIVFEAPKDGKDIEVKEVTVEIKELEKIPEPPEPEEVQVEQEVEIERPDVTTEDTEVVVEDVAVDAPAADVVMPNILSVKPTNSALVMPALFGMRTGNGRKAALKRYGGSGRTERSVLKGLRWLKDHQNPDGSWGNGSPSRHPALTSLALLAFLAHGETPSSAEFGVTVLKAIKKLKVYADTTDSQGVVKGAKYSHPMVSYALSEAYAVTKIPVIESSMNKCMSTVAKGINTNGGYDYKYKKSGRLDASLMGWNAQAMKAAFAAGSTVPNLEMAMDQVVVGFKSMQESDGSFVYAKMAGKIQQKRPVRMTPVSVLALQLLGLGQGAEAKKGLGWIQGEPVLNKMDWSAAKDYGSHDKGFGGWFLYTWYYQTQVYFQAYGGKGGKWKSWNKSFSRVLPREQESDGHWTSPTMKYCTDTQAKNNKYGETLLPFETEMNVWIYSTSLCCLMLEVYYRYLPTFKVAKNKISSTVLAQDNEEDLGLKMQ